MEKVTIVNEEDERIGFKPRSEITQDDIYRVTGLWITNLKGEILLAKRAMSKIKDPGAWGPAVAGTVDEGETYDENIVKEVKEELGIEYKKLVPFEKTRVKGKHNYFVQFYALVIDEKETDFNIQLEEVDEIKWYTKEELKDSMKRTPEMFTCSFPQYAHLFLAD